MRIKRTLSAFAGLMLTGALIFTTGCEGDPGEAPGSSVPAPSGPAGVDGTDAAPDGAAEGGEEGGEEGADTPADDGAGSDSE